MKFLLSIGLFMLAAIPSNAQSVGIGSPAPHPSAALDIQASNKGLLVPRVFLTGLFDTATIANPAPSLLVFNTNPNLDGGQGFYGWNGNYWTLIMSSSNSYSKGKNRFLTMVDSVAREYFVHVPLRYDGATKLPVVFMLHGTSGNGEKFYNTSGWVDVSEEENLIAVFPSSMRYCIVDGAEAKYTTKWNVVPDAEWSFCPGQTPRSDIEFLKKIISELRAKFQVDTTRIYLEGFSNGGQMAAKCAIEMSDVLAAVVENAGTFFIDTTYVPKRKLPVLYQIGNEDWGPGNTGPKLPLSKLPQVLNGTYPDSLTQIRFGRAALRHIKYFGLSTSFAIQGDTSKLVMASYSGLSGQPLNIFRYVLVDGMKHVYPNGENHWLEAARYHWAWMKQYKLPN